MGGTHRLLAVVAEFTALGHHREGRLFGVLPAKDGHVEQVDQRGVMQRNAVLADDLGPVAQGAQALESPFGQPRVFAPGLEFFEIPSPI